jgi:hypothetical protein
MDNEEQRLVLKEYYTEPTATHDRKCPYDSSDSINSIVVTTVLSSG